MIDEKVSKALYDDYMKTMKTRKKPKKKPNKAKSKKNQFSINYLKKDLFKHIY